MKVLALDTSNKPMSVAVMDEKKQVLAEKTINVKRNHSIQLMPTVDALMKEVGWTVSDLDRVAVAQGPGSYTGVRIAVTVAKTLAWTANLELVGVSSLKLLAANASQVEGQLISPLFDARRGNIYTGLYQWTSEGKLSQVEEDTHISAEKWAEFLKETNQSIECVGQDFAVHKENFQALLGDKVKTGLHAKQLPRAAVLAELAWDEEPVDIHTFTPAYLKLAEAEEKWKEAHPNVEGGAFVEKV